MVCADEKRLGVQRILETCQWWDNQSRLYDGGLEKGMGRHRWEGISYINAERQANTTKLYKKLYNIKRCLGETQGDI